MQGFEMISLSATGKGVVCPDARAAGFYFCLNGVWKYEKGFVPVACMCYPAVSARLLNILTAGNRQSGVLETSGPAIWKPEFR